MRNRLASVLLLVPALAWPQQQPAAGEAPQPPPPQAQTQPPQAQEGAQAQPYPPPPPPGYQPPPPGYQPPPPGYQPPAYPPPGYAPPPGYPPPGWGPPGYPPRPPAAGLPRGHRRDPWYIGFGLGWGNGSVRDATGSSTFGEILQGYGPQNVSFNFKIGATLNPRMLLGLDVNGVRSYGSSGGIDAALQVTNYDAMFTFFPAAEGFFLRGGAGLAQLLWDTTLGSSTHEGFGVVGGLGYAFWLARSFNLTLNLDVSGQWYGGSGAGTPTSSRLVNVYLGFDWY